MDTIGIKMIKDTEAEFPMYQTEGSVGMDLCSMDTVTIEPLDRVKIHTGIYIELPEGYEAQIRPRSGLACKHGITVANTPGTIDCLSGDTNIKLLDGTIDSLRNIVDRVNNGETIYVYSIDDKDGKLAPGLITHAVNKGKKDTLKITFNNGTKIICTPNHEFRTYKGDYIKASDLQIGSRVSPLNYHKDKDGYEIFTSLRYSKIGKYERVHRSIYESYHNLTDDSMPQMVHHIDETTYNNTPFNLQGVTSKEHYHIHEDTHSKMREWSKTESGQKHIKSFGSRVAFNPNRLESLKNNPNKKGFIGKETEAHKEKIRQAQLKAWLNKSEKRIDYLKNRNEKGLENALFIVKSIIQDNLKFTTSNYNRYKKKFIKEGKFKESKKLENLLNLFNNDKQEVISAAFNHFVTSIEQNGMCEVFDLTIDKYHNFLAEDVFVHNCDYRGEIIVCLINLSKESYTVNKGDRIAQMVIAKYSRVNMINIDTLTVTERGNGGFGSTGV